MKKILKLLLTFFLINSVNAKTFHLEIESILMVMKNLEKYNKSYKIKEIKYKAIPIDNCVCIIELSKNFIFNTLKVNICDKKIEEINT